MFGLGIVVGLAVAIIITVNVTPSSKLVRECEESLPRDQVCVLQAVPKELNK